MWPAGWSQKIPTGVTQRGVFSTKMNPRASAPASTATSASSRLVMPQIFTRVIAEWVGRDAPPISPPTRVARAQPAPPISPPTRVARAQPAAPISPPTRAAAGLLSGSFCLLRILKRQLADLGGDVAGADESFADQHGVGAGGDDPADVGAGEEAALADDDGAGRDRRRERERRFEARLERGQVAIVDPDDAAARGEGLIQLGGGVTLDQRREPEPLGGREQVAQLRRLQNRDDQQHRVGARGPRFPELILVDREILAEKRDVHRAPDRPQIVEAPLEVLLVGEDRDRVGAVGRVGGGYLYGVQIAGEHAAGG